jgi:hypothetical protein
MKFVQFREGSAFLYTEDEWFKTASLQPNYRRATIEVASEAQAQADFLAFREACRAANPTIDWSRVPVTVVEF